MSALATLGAEIRARREALGRTLRQTARALRRSPGWLSDVETARGGWSRLSPATLDEIVGLLGVAAATHDRWHALAGHVEPGLLRALLDAPERWAAVRAMLEVAAGSAVASARIPPRGAPATTASGLR